MSHWIIPGFTETCLVGGLDDRGDGDGDGDGGGGGDDDDDNDDDEHEDSLYNMYIYNYI
jgi:hypothetical protein